MNLLSVVHALDAFGHSFPTQLLAAGRNIRTAQELVGRKDVRTTWICAHALNNAGRGLRTLTGGP